MRPYYEHGGITIYHGDCRDVLPTVSWDVTVTDPPYGLGFPYLSYLDDRDGLSVLISEVWTSIGSRRAFVLCGPTQIGLYPQAGWVGCVVWDTTGSFGKFGYNQWTPVLCYGPDLPGFGNVNGTMKGDVIRISGGGGVGFQRTPDEQAHTCPKPLNLMKKVVQRYTAPTETILDPFMGSGTTLIAAKELGCRAIGIEIEERYCEIAARRLEQEVLPLGGAA